MYPSISYDDDDFFDKLLVNIKRDGLVVVTNVFDVDECDNLVNDIVAVFENLGTGIDRNKIEKTWTPYNLPPQTRAGLFQALMSNLEPVWQIRSNRKIGKIFRKFYSDFRGEPQRDFIVTGDGINVKPNNVGPYDKGNDWAHIDQTCYDDVYQCVQGQAVLTNTSACLVASPKSHLLYDYIRSKFGLEEMDSNWFRIPEASISSIKKKLEKIGGQYQIPILALKGSCIFWLSSLIHAARLQLGPEKSIQNEWDGWRCVVYVCYRPLSEFTHRQLNTRINAYKNNRTTNHWGKLFSKKPGSFHMYKIKKHPVIESMLDDPIRVYDAIGKPTLDNTQKILIGLQ